MSTRHLVSVDASNWRAFASCTSSEDPELFFPVGNGGPAYEAQAAEAKAVCATCPFAVREECLAYALEHRSSGIWAGTDDHERSLMKRRATRRRTSDRPTPVERCTYAGQARGVMLHERDKTPTCEPCVAYSARMVETKAREERILALDARGFTVAAIASAEMVKAALVRNVLTRGVDRGAKCGTDGGFMRHTRRDKTPACAPCREAHAEYERGRAARARAREAASCSA